MLNADIAAAPAVSFVDAPSMTSYAFGSVKQEGHFVFFTLLHVLVVFVSSFSVANHLLNAALLLTDISVSSFFADAPTMNSCAFGNVEQEGFDAGH